MTDSPAHDTAGRPFATWRSRPAVLVVLAVAVGGTLLTAVGSAVGQVAVLPEVPAILTLAVFVLVSAALGLLLMARTGGLAAHGVRAPEGLGRVLAGLPLLVLPVLVLGASGVQVSPSVAGAYALLTVAVGLNEEVWFRGLLLAALRRFGQRRAVLVSAALFGVLHLVNALQQPSATQLALQAVFALLVGVVLAEVVSITGSLWIGVAWHALHDFVSYLGGDSTAPPAQVALGVGCAVLLGYAVLLWRRVPHDG